jgi:adenosine deaminase
MRPLQGLAKAELHYHLEGGMRYTTLIELCHKYNLPVPPDTRHQRYTNFDNFALAYRTACNCLREPEDIYRIVHEMLVDALDAGCIWMEVAPSLLLYCHRFGGVEDTILLLQAASAAEDALQGKAACAYIISAERMNPTIEAENLATVTTQLVLSGQHIIHDRPGIVGFDLHGPEIGYPPELFINTFNIIANCCTATATATTTNNKTEDTRLLASIPHAGEFHPGNGISGPDSIRTAINSLGATRIGHGVLATSDTDLLDQLVISSNVLLHVVPNVKQHPLPYLLHMGIPVTINSDDPLLFGNRILDEYEVARVELNLCDVDIAQIGILFLCVFICTQGYKTTWFISCT